MSVVHRGFSGSRQRRRIFVDCIETHTDARSIHTKDRLYYICETVSNRASKSSVFDRVELQYQLITYGTSEDMIPMFNAFVIDDGGGEVGVYGSDE